MTEERMRVPTAPELAAISNELAYATDWDAKGHATKWHITDEGHELLGTVMRRNAILFGVTDPFDSTREERREQAAEARRKANKTVSATGA